MASWSCSPANKGLFNQNYQPEEAALLADRRMHLQHVEARVERGGDGVDYSMIERCCGPDARMAR